MLHCFPLISTLTYWRLSSTSTIGIIVQHRIVQQHSAVGDADITIYWKYDCSALLCSVLQFGAKVNVSHVNDGIDVVDMLHKQKKYQLTVVRNPLNCTLW